MKKYVEPRLRRDFGGILEAYLNFLKGNIKGLFNVFVNYNAVVFILIFGASFLTSSGLSGMMDVQMATVSGVPMETTDTFVYYILGVLASLVVYFVAVMINAAISGAYIKLYEANQSNNPDRKAVWKIAKGKLGGLFLILLIGGILGFVLAIVGVIVLIIPLLGILFYLAVFIAYANWIGLSMFAYTYHDDYSIGTAMGKGWELMFSKFWKALGFLFVVFLLVSIVSFGLQLIPTGINFYATFNSISETGGISESIAFKVFFFVFNAISTIISVFAFLIIQSSVGFLYLNLHEHQHNQYLRSRIERLGIDS